jgi:hypothetical protein
MVQATNETMVRDELTPARAATADSGRVRLGGGMISFDDVKIRDEIKDAGRTKLGGGMIQF